MKVRTKRTIILVLSIVSLIVAPGCWDRVELEDIAWIQAIGFDKGPPGYLMTTFEVGISRNIGGEAAGGVGGGQPQQITVSVLSRTALEAVDLVSTNLGRRVSAQHAGLFVFGEELARSDIRALLQALDRFRDVRFTSYVAVARGRAEDVLRIHVSPMELSPARFIQTIVQQHQQTGLFETTQFGRFVSALSHEARSPTCPIVSPSREVLRSMQRATEQPQPSMGSQSGQKASGNSQTGDSPQPPTPSLGERMTPPQIPPAVAGKDGGSTSLGAGEVPRIGGAPVELVGTAVFQAGRMVGEFSPDETRTMLMVKGDFERGAFAVPDPLVPDKPEYSMGAVLTGAKIKKRVKRDADKVEIDLNLSLDITYMSIGSQTDYTDPRNQMLAERAFADLVKSHLDQAIMRSQKEFKSDAFGFGYLVKGTFRTWPEWEAFAWQSKYPDAIIRTRVETKLRHAGKNFGPFPVTESEKLQQRK